MRILVVTQYFWPEEFRVNDLVKTLRQRGHEVTVLTGVPNYPDGAVFDAYKSQPAAFSSFEGATVHRIPMLARGKGSIRLALNYLSFALSGLLIGPFKVRKDQFDVIFVFLVSPVTTALPALWLGRLKRVPVVLWVLDLWPQSLEAVGAVRNRSVLNLVGGLVGFIYRRATIVLGQSRSFLEDFRKYLSDGTRMGYLPGWAEQALVDTTGTSTLPAGVPSGSGLFTVTFTGNIGEAQDFPAVLDAAERLRDRPVRWLIVGDGRKAAWVREEVERRGLAEKVLLPGRFPMEQMPAFHSQADAMLVSLRPDPIFAMTIPGKVQAYLMSGKPILAMLDGEGAEVVRRAGAGYAVCAGDGAGLAAAVETLMGESAESRAAMGQRGRDYAQREFDRETVITRLEGYLRDAIARKARR